MSDQITTASAATIYIRPELENGVGAAVTGEVMRPISVSEQISNIDSVRKLAALFVVVCLWELYTRFGGINELMFPTFTATATALYDAIVNESLMLNVWNSLKLLLTGYAIGISFAVALVVLAVGSRFGSDLLTTLTAMLNPLPAVALLPMAMLWFGLGSEAIIFTLLHSIIWPVALNTHAGFLGVSETHRMVGKNYSLKGLAYIGKILVPAAFPNILTGLRIAWAFSWRTLIAAELVFGGQVMDTSGNLGAEGSTAGGLGYIIFQNQMESQTSYVFAGLFMVILVGIVVENGVFLNIEERTIRKWGMQQS